MGAQESSLFEQLYDQVTQSSTLVVHDAATPPLARNSPNTNPNVSSNEYEDKEKDLEQTEGEVVERARTIVHERVDAFEYNSKFLQTALQLWYLPLLFKY